MSTIQCLSAIEILDSRGRPTLKTTCTLSSGTIASASVPSGASTGKAEALELRDGDKKRYRGLGCLKAVQQVNALLNESLSKQNFNQKSLDDRMLTLDATPNKSALGANAILSVSLAFARANAHEQTLPLYEYFSSLTQTKPALPNLTINLFSGGKHAGGQVDIQDVLMVPHAASINQQLAMAYEVYQVAAEMTSKKYTSRPLKADEGGLAPAFSSTKDMFQDALKAIQGAGLIPGKDMSLAVDVASSHFYQDGVYTIDKQRLSSLEMIDLLESWVNQYPIVILEDGLAEEGDDSTENATDSKSNDQKDGDADPLSENGSSGIEKSDAQQVPVAAVNEVEREQEGEQESSEEQEEDDEPEFWHCECCRKDFKSEGQLQNHMKSKKHKEAFKRFEKKLGELQHEMDVVADE